MTNTISDLISQLEVAVPVIMAAVLLLTSTIKGIFQITSDIANKIISWVIAVGTGCAFVACNQLTFGYGGWDYALAAVCGIIVGLSVNEIYSWEKIKAILDIISNLFGGKTYKAKKLEVREAKLLKKLDEVKELKSKFVKE